MASDTKRTWKLTTVFAWAFVMTINVAIAAPPLEKIPEAIAGRVFVPHAGYANTNAALHFKRRARERGALFAPGQNLTVHGTRSIPVICVEFDNVSATFPTTDYDRILFDTARPSLSRYYTDISQGQFTVTGRVVGWYKAPKKDNFYENGQNGGGAPFGELLRFALEKADADLDFGQFDNDGPDGVPNSGDDDGIADTVFFIHPEGGAECDNGTNIWSHSWHYSDPSYGNGGKPFVSKDVRKNSQGFPVLDASGNPTRILVEDYTIQPGLACSGGGIIEVGVYCHEYGHALGMPDNYDRTPRAKPDSKGLGNWCLMAGGSYGGDGKHSERPSRMSAFVTYYLGWSVPIELTSADDIELEPVRIRNEIFKVVVPETNGLEYFLLEYRQNGTGAAGTFNWDEYLPGSGLAVWHVDENVGSLSAQWPFSVDDQGQNDSPVRLADMPPPIFRKKHPLIAMVQADGRMDLDTIGDPQNRGDAGDLFVSGSKLADDPTGKAGTRAYSGKETGFSLNSIAVNNNFVTGKVTVPASPAPVALAVNAAPPVGYVQLENQQLRARLSGIASKAETGVGTLKIGDKATTAKLRAAAQGFSEIEKDVLAKARPTVLQESLQPAVAETLRELSSALRTREVAAPDPSTPTGAAETAVQNIVKDSQSDSPATINLSRGGNISQITGLKVSVNSTMSLGEDAAQRLGSDENLAKAFGYAGKVSRITSSVTDSLQEFRQTAEVGGQQLPVFGTRVALHYNQNRELVAATANVLPKLTDITGLPDAISQDSIVRFAAAKLGVPKENVKFVEQGIYVAPGAGTEESPGRVAYRLEIPAPGGKPLSVYVDGKGTKILEIK